MDQTAQDERIRARQYGFYALGIWASLGVALEIAHAFKLSSYLDHPERRALLAWGHAHGVGLSLVVLAYAAVGVVNARSARWGPRLRLAATLIPTGFVLGVFGQTETDPGPAIWLIPAGALLLCASLFGIARSQR